MKKNELIVEIIGGLILFGLGIFSTEIKTLIMNHYQLLIFGIGILFISLGIISRWVRYVFKKEFEEKFNAVSAQNKNIQENFNSISQTWIDITRINHAVILNMIKNSKSKEQSAEILMSFFTSRGLTIPEWEKYQIPNDIIDELKKLHHKTEIEKIKKQLKKENESN
jgi:hypothetical protein